MSDKKINNIFKIKSDFSLSPPQEESVSSIVDSFINKKKKQTLLGVTGSGKTFVVANVIEKMQCPALIMAPNKTLAAQLYAEMKTFFPDNHVEYFVSYYNYYQPEAYVAASDIYIEKDSSINEVIEQMRLSTTRSLIEHRDVIVVASVSAIYGLGDPNAYREMLLDLRVGLVISRGSLLHSLIEMQYVRNDIEFSRGVFRVKGDIIDIFPSEEDAIAVRVVLFDDEIEAIRLFDPLTGALIESLSEAKIFPKSHYVATRDKVLLAVDRIKADLQIRLAELDELGLLVERQRLLNRTQYDIEMMLEAGYCSGVENYSLYFSDRNPGNPSPTLLDYFPDDALFVLDESHVTVSQIGAMYHGDRSRKENLITYGFRLPSALDNRPLKFDEFEAFKRDTLYVSATPGDYEKKVSDETVELLFRPTGIVDPVIVLRPVGSQVDDLLSEIKLLVEKSQRVLVTTLTKKMAEDLCAYYEDLGIRVSYLHSDIDTIERVTLLKDLRSGKIDVLIGINLLREGLDLPEVALVAIMDADKAGFLRSARALIQTIGRAARHIEGRVIMYGDRITPAMSEAIAESDRRRELQLQYNVEHGIVPHSIVKPVSDILVGDSIDSSDSDDDIELDSYILCSDSDRESKLLHLQKEMLSAADDLDFEKAIELRQTIKLVREAVLRQVK